MNFTLVKALVAAIPAWLLLSGAAVSFARKKTVASSLPLVGAGCVALVVLIHIFEALRVLRSMGWGLEHSGVITSISSVPQLASRCFHWDIYFTRHDHGRDGECADGIEIDPRSG